MTKQEARKLYKQKREAAASLEASAEICRLLRNTPAYRNAACVMAYLSFGTEVETPAFARAALADGKRLVVPVCRPEDSVILPAELMDFDRELSPGHYGILEPEPVRPAELCAIDLAVVPGVAFDRRGYRIGYGKGYYDRFLPRLRSDAVTVGLCYEGALADALPHDSYDVAVDYVITERELIHCAETAF